MSKFRASVRKVIDGDLWRRQMSRMKRAADDQITGGVEETVARVIRRLDLDEEESVQVKRSFKEEEDFSRWGVINAITSAAHVAESYDRATELQRLGGEILKWGEPTWAKVNIVEQRRLRENN